MENMDAAIKDIFTKIAEAIGTNFSDAENVKLSSDGGNPELSMDIPGSAHITCTMKPDIEMIILRSDSNPDGLSNDELNILGSEIAEKIDARKTAYDGALVIMKSLTADSLESRGTKEKIFNDTMLFIQNIIMFKARLQGSKSNPLLEGSYDTAMQGDKDPFNFSAFFPDGEDGPQENGEGEEPGSAQNGDIIADAAPDGPAFADSGEGNPDGYGQTSPEDVTGGETENAQEGTGMDADPVATPPVVDAVKPTEGMADSFKEIDQLLSSISIGGDTPDVQAGPAFEAALPVFSTSDFEDAGKYEDMVNEAGKYREAFMEISRQAAEMGESVYGRTYELAASLRDRHVQLLSEEENIRLAQEDIRNRDMLVREKEEEVSRLRKEIEKKEQDLDAHAQDMELKMQDYDQRGADIETLKEQISELSASLERAKEEAAEASKKLQMALSGGDGTNKYVESLQKENDRKTLQIRQMAENLDKYSKAAALFKTCQAEWEKTEDAYRQQICALAAQAESYKQASVGAANTQEVDKLKAENERLQNELQTAKKIAEDAEKRAEKEKEEHERTSNDLLAAIRESKDMERRAEAAENGLSDERMRSNVVHNAVLIRDTLQTAGINLETVPGESEMVMSCIYNGCHIVADVGSCIIYISKEVAKPSKYIHQVDEINKRDIRTAFSLGSKDITCRAIYTDADTVAAQVTGILSIMESFD